MNLKSHRIFTGDLWTNLAAESAFTTAELTGILGRLHRVSDPVCLSPGGYMVRADYTLADDHETATGILGLALIEQDRHPLAEMAPGDLGAYLHLYPGWTHPDRQMPDQRITKPENLIVVPEPDDADCDISDADLNSLLAEREGR